MKKLMTAILVTVLSVSFAGCAETGNVEISDTTTEVISESVEEASVAQFEEKEVVVDKENDIAIAETDEVFETTTQSMKYPWKEAYISQLEAISKNADRETASCFKAYWIYDIDEDGTPELVALTNPSDPGAVLHFYTFDGSNAVSLGECSGTHANICGYKGENGILVQSGHMEYENDTVVTIERDSINTKIKFSGHVLNFHDFTSIESSEFPSEEYNMMNWEGNPEDSNRATLEDIRSEYVFPDSGIIFLTEEDIKGMDDSTLRIGLNEIYARHGRRFVSEDLQEYFNNKSWYIGKSSPEAFDESILTDTERQNITFLDGKRNGTNYDFAGIVPPSKKYTDKLEYGPAYIECWDSIEENGYTYEDKTGMYLYVESSAAPIDRGGYYEVPYTSITLITGFDMGDCPLEYIITKNTTVYIRKDASFGVGMGNNGLITAKNVYEETGGRLYRPEYSELTLLTCNAHFDENGFMDEGTCHGFG